jgi:DNA polymerase III alpha subunit (gram-positive type)
MQYPDVMVDLETTGLAPDETAILQIGAVRFNLQTQEVDATDMFNQSLMIPPKRFWDESTRSWWMQRKSTLQEVMANMRDTKTVLEEFARWSDCGNGASLHFWAKPLSFDYPFVQSYFRQFEIPMPFDFRKGENLNSFLRGLYFPNPIATLEIPFQGTAHNALMDSLHQIQMLFTHINHVKSLKS